MRHIYLDHNATTPPLPEVLELFTAWWRDGFGNPSSIHWAGRRARAAREEAREQVARFCGCDPAEVIFTSGGTEADNLAIKGVAAASTRRGRHIITTEVEHPAVLGSCLALEREGFTVTRIPVDREGLPDPAELEAAITPETTLISVMYANNETGVIMPVTEVAACAARHRVPFHCDAVQAAGRLPLSCREQGINLLSLSGHKLGAPPGVGALVARTGVRCHPLLHGGAQERNRRAGTENLPGIIAFGRACELAASAMYAETARLGTLRDRLEEGLVARCPGARINGHRTRRLANTCSISFPGLSADSLLIALDLEGVAASSGAACSSGTIRFSPVLAAMGLTPDEAAGSLRLSLGRGNSDADIDSLLETIPAVVTRLRGSGGERDAA